MLEARSAEARPRIRGEASLEAQSAGAASARAAFDAAQLRRFASKGIRQFKGIVDIDEMQRFERPWTS